MTKFSKTKTTKKGLSHAQKGISSRQKGVSSWLPRKREIGGLSLMQVNFQIKEKNANK